MNRTDIISWVTPFLLLAVLLVTAADIGYRMNPVHQPTQVTIKLTCVSTEPAHVTCTSSE